ncbi:MAG: 1,3-beta-galactosyl-N-acetylhexosamine phosphorylase [Clostridia bacterium]
MDEKRTGRVTIPTDVDVVPETLALMKRWGADAIRDCDGTDFPEALKETGAKVYSTYYTTRKDNAWAKANPDEVQQCYLMTGFHTAVGGELSILLMQGVSPELMQVNDRDEITRWWEVIDRTTGAVVPTAQWGYDADKGCVTIPAPVPFHDYTVSFLAYLIWDPVHMYNAVVNDWKNVEHQITFDVRQPKTHAFTMERLRRFIAEHPYVSVIRYTTFFHQFTLVFDELKREKYVDWYGYSASVSPYILRQFEQEVGYPFRAEYIIDQGYYNNQYRVPSAQFKDFQAFQRREVAKLAKELVDITHELGKEAMMFLGDHWIGTEPFMEEFQQIGLDAVVGSVGNGSTLRLISDSPGVKYTEGRFLPYFFPDTFHEGGDPVKEAKVNWVTARRAILRKPIDRIGYGGYLKLACQFPDFLAYVESVCDEFRLLYENIRGTTPYCVKTVAVLNCWGKMRAWGCHMVHHALYQQQNYSYAGVIEALSGAPFDVRFLSFDELKANPAVLDGVDVLLNLGDGDTAHTGGAYWEDAEIVAAVKGFIHRGGGFIGVGQPSGHAYQGRYFQLGGVMGVEKELGFTLNYDKYNWEVAPSHFITEDCTQAIDFGEGQKSVYALAQATILARHEKEVQMAVSEFGEGRSVYLSGLPYSFENSRLLYRSILWSAHAEEALHQWYSSNFNVEVHAYVKNGKYCVVNNTYEPQETVVFRGDGTSFALLLDANEIKWYEM